MNSKNKTDPVAAISTTPPALRARDVARVLADEFGLVGRLTALVSERDQNFVVQVADGRRFVCKIANAAENPVITDFQIKALLHVEQQGCAVSTPAILRTLAGEDATRIDHDGRQHVCRVVSYLSGTPLSAAELSEGLAKAFGQGAATLDLALSAFTHAGDNQVLLWDLRRASALRELLPYIPQPELHAAVGACLDDFESFVLPVLPTLRTQVIHADLNADNVLVADHDHATIAGIIDFGDMLRAPLIMEVAIAASYLRVLDGDELGLIAPFIRGFNSVLPLQDDELALLFDLIRARLAATISILRWRASLRGEGDEYSRHFLRAERSAEPFLLRLDELGRDEFGGVVADACCKR